ncbi:RcpC/CpaB family pilus assembly protein [Streptomyces sp. NPDC005355]|uniref:RcpC/CpaB family pilus assembly protein n=1 Tax=Streptomyces sp. NPDC005355 TaxID=3157038 RepID=UPI0033B6D3FD
MSHPSPTLALPRSAPPARAVPRFGPVRVGRDGGYRVRRAVRRRRRAMAAGLALTAAALAAAAPPGQDPTDRASSPAPAPAAEGRPGSRTDEPRPALVSAPVRIADAAAVRLLHPGDRVDVLAAPAPDSAAQRHGSGAAARMVARGVTVASVPGPRGGGAVDGDSPAGDSAGGGAGDTGASADGGALVVLTVPREAAAALAGAAATSRLAVALCRS